MDNQNKLENFKSLIITENDNFLKCPITTNIFFDPVIAEDGHTYERHAIQNWLLNFSLTSPTYNTPMGYVLIPNFFIRDIVNKFKSKNNLPIFPEHISDEYSDFVDSYYGEFFFKTSKESRKNNVQDIFSPSRERNDLKDQIKELRLDILNLKITNSRQDEIINGLEKRLSNNQSELIDVFFGQFDELGDYPEDKLLENEKDISDMQRRKFPYPGSSILSLNSLDSSSTSFRFLSISKAACNPRRKWSTPENSTTMTTWSSPLMR